MFISLNYIYKWERGAGVYVVYARDYKGDFSISKKGVQKKGDVIYNKLGEDIIINEGTGDVVMNVTSIFNKGKVEGLSEHKNVFYKRVLIDIEKLSDIMDLYLELKNIYEKAHSLSGIDIYEGFSYLDLINNRIAYYESQFGYYFIRKYPDKVYDDIAKQLNKTSDDVKTEVNKALEEAKSLKISSIDPYVGMEEIRLKKCNWGEPKEIKEYDTEKGLYEQWIYSDNRYVYVEDGIVKVVKKY